MGFKLRSLGYKASMLTTTAAITPVFTNLYFALSMTPVIIEARFHGLCDRLPTVHKALFGQASKINLSFGERVGYLAWIGKDVINKC